MRTVDAQEGQIEAVSEFGPLTKSNTATEYHRLDLKLLRYAPLCQDWLLYGQWS